MMQLSSKNDDSSLCYDVIITHQNFKNCVFSSDIDFKTKMDIFRDVSLIINQSHLQATEGSLRRTQSVRQPRSPSKRSALVYILIYVYIYIYIYMYELIEETARRRKLIFGMSESFGYGSSSSELRRKCCLIMEL